MIAAISSKMLDKAQTQQWDELTMLGESYFRAIEALRELGPLGDQQKTARRELLTQILENDARIRELIAPELKRLGHLIGTFKRQRHLLQSYYSAVRAE